MFKLAGTVGLVALSIWISQDSAKEAAWKSGAPELSSAGALAFGPGGVLFVADPVQASLLAVRTGDTKGDPSSVQLAVDGIDERIADLLGTSPANILINDLAVNPASGNTYLSVSRGRGEGALPVLVRVDGEGGAERARARRRRVLERFVCPTLRKEGGGPSRSRTSCSLGDQVIVAGLSNEEFASKLRSVAYPFEANAPGTSVEIYHGAHGAYETRRSRPHLGRVPDRRQSRTSWRPTPARRWSCSRSRSSSRARRSAGRPSPSSATATGRSTWSSTRRTARSTS